MHTTTADRAAPDQAPSYRPAPRPATGLPGALLSHQQSAGNAAVSGMVRALQRAPKPIDMRLTAAPDDAVVFETPKARLGDVEVHFTGRLWVLGTSGKAVVSDPSPAQLVERGYFTLKQNSTSAPGGKAQPGAFDVPFVKAMVKHGFNHGGNWGTPDFMHFELRWTGPAKRKP